MPHGVMHVTMAVSRVVVGQILCLLQFAAICSNSPTPVPTATPGHQMNTILMLDIEDKKCHSDVINSAVKEAVQELNAAELFPYFTLNTTTLNCGLDTRCYPNDAKDVVFRELITTPYQLAIVGPTCSGVSSAIAELSWLFQIPMVSLAPSIPTKNRYLFSLLPTLTTLMDGVTAFLETYPEWTRVAIVTQDTEMFRKAGVYIERALTVKNITVETKMLQTGKLQSSSINTLVKPTRIVLLNMESNWTHIVLCKAMREIEHQYVWITHGFYDDWWHGNYECPEIDLHDFLDNQGVLSISTTQTKVTCARNKDSVLRKQMSPQLTEADPLSLRAYDSVLSIALGLNFTILETHGPIRALGTTLASNLGGTKLDGFSGDVCFEDNELKTEGFTLFQFRKGNQSSLKLMGIGTIYLRRGLVFRDGEHRESLWENGIPSDGSAVTEEKYPLLVVTIVAYAFAGCNIITAVIGMLFMTAFRKRRLIRLSSPNLNYLVGIGLIIFNTGVFLFVYPPLPVQVINVFCGIRVWFLAIGYSLCLGTISTKMWRVYYIFRNPNATSSKTPLKDWHLTLFVALFVLIDVILLSLSSSFPTARLQAVMMNDIENEEGVFNEDGLEVEYNVTLCDSDYKLYWLAILFGYKIITHLIAVFLAFKIRKVKIKVLNDSKEVVLILYLTGLVLVTVMIIAFAFGSYLNVYSGAYTVGICTTSAVILGVVFVSKAIQLYKDPDGAKIFPPSSHVNTAAEALATCDEMREIANLQKKVKTLEAQLSFFHEPKLVFNDSIDQGNSLQTSGSF